MILHGDSLHILKTLDENSVDSIVTDPPYGLKFMGKKWDYEVPSVELWREALRVLKPGGHLLSFGGTRTYHRMVVNIEDAGFEIRDQIMWIYGSGFPKSQDVSKAIDKQAGAEREVIGDKTFADGSKARKTQNLGTGVFNDPVARASNLSITAPATEAAKQWQGWGTALKPANEPIVMARKPLEAKLTVAANVLKYGTGGLNIDASRIGSEESPKMIRTETIVGANAMSGTSTGATNSGKMTSQGRWPANILFDEEAAQVLDDQTQHLHGAGYANTLTPESKQGNIFRNSNPVTRLGDSGGASRFFYVAKASKSERNKGLEGMQTKSTGRFQANRKCRLCGYQEVSGSACECINPEWEKVPIQDAQNHHPTVKPIKLMQYLIKLITPPQGIVLDPFAGSGSTGVACKSLGFEFIGIELNNEYVEIAERRIDAQCNY